VSDSDSDSDSGPNLVTCPRCGAQYLATATTCVDCGTRLRGAGDEGGDEVAYDLADWTAEQREDLVEALAAEGVRQVYGLPGTTIMHVLDALARQDRIRYLSVRHEQVAAFMADGYSRGSAEVGVCIASRGPGAANMATAIANAHDESVPLVALVGQVADDIVDRAAFEEMDLLSVFRPITKWCVEVHEPERIAELVQRAVRTAVSGRPGPVLVSLPLDVLTAPVAARPQPRFRPAPPAPDPDAVRSAARLLRAADRPVIIVGGGVRREPFDGAVQRLAAAAAAPVATTWSRKDRFPGDDPHYVGALGAGSLPVTDETVRDADVVVALGCRFSEFTTKRWTLPPPGVTLVHADIDPGELGRVFVPAVGLVADAGRAAVAIAEALAEVDAPPGRAESRTRRLAERRATYRTQARLPVPDPPAPATGSVTSAQLTAALRDVLEARSATLVVDAPSTGVWIQRYVPVLRAGSHFSSAGGAMAWGFPAALGIALARPADRVVCLSGDGSFWMVAHDLETAVRERIPVVTVVADNFAYGNTRDRQRIAHEARYLGVFYDNPDLAAFARLHGAHGERVESAADLVPALQRALDSGLPAVVDVVQDRHEGLPPDVQPLPSR
jgi:acetolactate synthase-1/2/3 large subunit